MRPEQNIHVVSFTCTNEVRQVCKEYILIGQNLKKVPIQIFLLQGAKTGVRYEKKKNRKHWET